MAGEEMDKEISDRRRRRSRAGSNLNVNINGGGVVLLIGAAAGALFASAFAAYRIRAHKRRRGSMTDGIMAGSDEHLASDEAKEFVGDEGGEGDGANAEEGVVQVISHESFDASVQISQFDKKEMDFYLLEEGKKEVRERSPTAEIELVDGDHGKLVGCKDSNADITSSPENGCGNSGIGNSFGENQKRCDDEELVAASIKEERKTSFINCKEDDEEDNKKAYLEEWGKGEEIEENLTSSNLYSEQARLIEDNNLSNSEMTLEREECYLEAAAEELGTVLNEKVDEREDETNSVQCHELETRQYIEIHKEPQSQITEEEDEEEQILKLSFDLVEKGAKIVAKTIKQDTKTELIDVDKKHQRQVEGHENIVSSEGKQQITATKQVKGIKCTFMGYFNGHIFLVTTLATAFAILAFLYTKDFITRTNILENFISG